MNDAVLRFGAKDDGSVAATVRRISGQLGQFTSDANKASESVAKTFAILKGAAAVSAVVALAKAGVDFADQMVRASKQTDIAIESLQGLAFVADQADVGFDSLTAGVNRLQRALVNADEGQKAASETLAKLGVNVATFFNMKPDEQFREVSIAIAGIKDSAERTAAAMDLFGRGGSDLLPLMRAIAEESDQIGVAFARIGGAIGEETVVAIDAMGDAASGAGLAVKSLGIEILGLAAPAITATFEGLQAFFGGLRYAIFGASDAVTQLEDKIRDLEKARDSFSGNRGMSAASGKAGIQAQIDALISEQSRQLGLETPGRSPIKVDDLLGGILKGPNIPSTPEEDEARKRREKEEDEAAARRERQAEEVQKKTLQDTERLIAARRKLEEDALEDQIKREQAAAKFKFDINTDLYDLLSRIRETFNIREIKLEEIKNKSIFGLAAELFSDLAGANTKFAKLQQGIAIAQTVWYTATGIMNAFRTLPWPASLVAAGKVALTGAIQVAKIKATNYSGGGGSAPTVSGGSSVSGSEQTPPAQLPETDSRGATSVYISGLVTHEVIDQLLDGLRDGFSRDVVIIPSNSLQATEIRGAA